VRERVCVRERECDLLFGVGGLGEQLPEDQQLAWFRV